MTIQLISVHTPKCAGSSLKKSFEKHFGNDQVFLDYGDSPFNPISEQNLNPEKYFSKWKAHNFEHLKNKKIIHGHFHVDKYAALTNAARFTILRNPVDRLISHYYFWQNFPRHEHPLQNYMLDNKLSLYEFAEIPSVRFFYSKVFFKNVDMKSFQLVGKFENMQKFYADFKKEFGIELKIFEENKNRNPNYKSTVDKDTANSFKVLLKEDIEFFESYAN